MVSKRTSAPQDDTREQDMLRVFGLQQNPGSSRGDNDAFMVLPNKSPQCFELKSTVRDNFVTARDFSLNHINDWRKKHILASFYEQDGNDINSTLFVPNRLLQAWLDEQEDYIRADIEIIKRIGAEVTYETLDILILSLFGKKDLFEQKDLKKLLKQQIKSEEYDFFLDVQIDNEKLCSKKKMRDAFRTRIHYLLNRGSSRNNPHFNGGWIKKIISQDNRLSLKHKRGDYSTPKEWLLNLLNEYSI